MSQDPTTPRAQPPAPPMPDDAPLRPAAAAPGHLDEVHHQAVRSASADAADAAPMAPHWASFFEHLGPLDPQDLNRRASRLQRQLRDNGVTYNVYADAGGPPRPWSLDLFPLIVTPQSWRQIEAGVLQRTRLLERVMADIYGPQELLREGLIPPAL
ncbi:MAG: circularly permuted type 2 ATP-grasp protein, partial [Rhodoferax sp.]|nr:circularly permuted type 2 ATP-grasp protein [Rhodoferax sp.]